MKKKDKSEIKVTYHYVEPKTEEERAEQERNIEAVFNIIFEETVKSEGWQQYLADKRNMKEDNHTFTDEEISSFAELGGVLRSIHNRLVSEGWIIKDGVFTSPERLEVPSFGKPEVGE